MLKSEITTLPHGSMAKLNHLLRKKNDAGNKAKKTNSEYYHKKFCALRRECKSLINNNYNGYIDSLQASLHENPKRFWSYYRSKRKVTSVPATVKYCNQSFGTPVRQAEAFNKYFLMYFLLIHRPVRTLLCLLCQNRMQCYLPSH